MHPMVLRASGSEKTRRVVACNRNLFAGTTRAMTEPTRRRRLHLQHAPDRMIDAALRLIADGGCTSEFGLTFAAVARESGEPTSKVSYHFGEPPKRNLRQMLAELVTDEIHAEAAANADAYAMAAGAIADGAGNVGRKIVARAILGDLEDFDATEGSSDQLRGRERFYYLMLAMADLAPEKSGVDYKRFLARASTDAQAMYVKIYDEFCRVTNREYVADGPRTQRAINAYLEGVSVQRRFGAAPLDDEVVDTVVRLFHATTKPIGGADVDIDAELFGLPHEPRTASVAAHTTIHQERDALYREVTSALGELDPGETFSHCALHGPTRDDTPPSDPFARALYEAQHSHVARGGRLRRVALFSSAEELQEYIEWLREKTAGDSPWQTETRALIMDAAPAVSPLVVGRRFAALGRESEGTGRISDGMTFVTREGVAFVEAIFDTIWRDARAYPIASSAGINRRGVEDALRRLRDHE